MSQRPLIVLATALVLGLATLATAAAETRPAATQPAGWEVVKGEGFAMAVPRGWRAVERLPPRMVMLRQGDGIGIPALDETGEPLQVGFTVERFPGDAATTDESIKKLIASAKANPRLEVIGEPKVELLKLSGGRPATLLTTEFIKEGRRRSLQMKLLVKGEGDVGWVASGFLVGGKASKVPTHDSPTALWLRAHLESFSLDAAKVDEAAIEKAYAKRPRAGEAQ